MRCYDFTFRTEQLARRFIIQCWQEHPEDVSFYRYAHNVRVFDGSNNSVEESIRTIYNAMISDMQKPGPQATRRVTPLAVQAPMFEGTISEADERDD